MPTNLAIDDELLNEAQQVGGHRTNVIVDTSVWSLALRRAKRMDDAAPRELAELIQEGRVVMLGPVRRELLSVAAGTVDFHDRRRLP